MNILHLAFQVGLSKKIKRTGWMMRNVNDPESVAEHAFRVTVLCMVLASQLEINKEKLIKMAIIHDLGETATGDIVVHKGIKTDFKLRAKKEKIEKEAIKQILYGYDEDYAKLFHEMTLRKTREALIFWEIDVLERTIQAYEYEKEQKKDLTEFFEGAKIEIKTPFLRQILDDLLKMRKNL